MDKHHDGGGALPRALNRYTLGLDKVEMDAVLEACELVGHVLQSVAPDLTARTAARLLTEATRDEHHDEPLKRSVLVQVARALQRRGLQ